MKTGMEHKGSLPAKVVNLETGEEKTYLSLGSAGKAIGVHRSTVCRAVNSMKPINGKWLCSYDLLSEPSNYQDKETYLWDLNGKFFGKYPSITDAANAIGATQQGVSRAIITGGIVHKNYRASSEPLEVPVKERASKHTYIAHELKWEEIGAFKDIGDAAAATGLTPTTIRRICKSGFVYQKTFRGKMKSGKFLLEKIGWEKKGEYPRLVDLAEYSGMSTEAIGASIKRNDTCGGKYKFEKVQKSDATL